MATKNITDSALKLKFKNGLTKTGNQAYTTKTLKGINPQISDENILSVANSLIGLQSRESAEISRTDTEMLSA